jgi:hypothetical protein
VGATEAQEALSEYFRGISGQVVPGIHSGSGEEGGVNVSEEVWVELSWRLENQLEEVVGSRVDQKVWERLYGEGTLFGALMRMETKYMQESRKKRRAG